MLTYLSTDVCVCVCVCVCVWTSCKHILLFSNDLHTLLNVECQLVTYLSAHQRPVIQT